MFGIGSFLGPNFMISRRYMIQIIFIVTSTHVAEARPSFSWLRYLLKIRSKLQFDEQEFRGYFKQLYSNDIKADNRHYQHETQVG